ncbi:uncharacterized protein LOC131160790 [Malania oleifera]|uniref:uncharacterized protein LOC131160790 n=1 Tax=Malania oleifera TaxID=397392 RepID=UPI0025ADBE97|nr:uncharacterized protein LOC131160790 [Malania oleifera]
MVEYIYMVQELVRGYAIRRICPRCLLKIDLKKAYDSAAWPFLKEMLIHLRFPAEMISWIMECVTTTSYSISLNGRFFDFFKGSKVLRRGDPLSPLLFVIYVEYLSRLLKSVESKSNFKFHPKCEALRLSHLVFADDLMMFSRGDLPSVRYLMNYLNEFLNCSGLAVNLLKLELYHAGNWQEELGNISNLSGMKLGAFPFKYLSIPLLSSRLNAAHYSPLINRIAGMFKGWPCHTLSYAGKLEIINSIIQGVECFWLAIFPFPLNVLNQIVKLYRVFLWGGRRKPLVAWREICLSKTEGGLGVFDLNIWNIALLSKALWNIHSKKDSVWTKWIYYMYLTDSSIWNISAAKNNSPLFKKLLTIRDQLVVNCGGIDAAVDMLSKWENRGKLSYEFWRAKGHKVP